MSCFTKEMLRCSLCIVPSATSLGHLLPCGPPCVNHRSRAHRKTNQSMVFVCPYSALQGKEGKGKKQYKKWASFSDARWAKTKSCCNSLSTNIFLLSMAWEKKMTFYKSNWFSLSNNRPAENCFEGRSYPEQQLQTELDLLWDWTTASVGSFSLPIARLCALPLYFAVLAVSAISESVAPHCIIKIVVPSFSMLIQRLPGARRNTTWRVFLSTKRQMKRLWEVRCHKIIRQRWDHCRGYLNSDE